MAAGLFSRRSALAGLLACVGLALAQPALAGGSPPDADHFAQSACQGLQEHLGAAAFASTFGSLDGCVAKVSSLVRACSGHAGADGVQACVKAQLRLGGGAKGAGKSVPDAAQLARSACQGLQGQLGAAGFASKFGSLDSCVATVSSLVSACKAQAPSGGDAFKACVKAQLRPSSGDKGASKSVPDASQFARSACQGLQGQLGAAGFATRFGSLDACAGKLTSLVSACKAQAPSGGDAFKGCVEAQLATGLPSSK